MVWQHVRWWQQTRNIVDFGQVKKRCTYDANAHTTHSQKCGERKNKSKFQTILGRMKNKQTFASVVRPQKSSEMVWGNVMTTCTTNKEILCFLQWWKRQALMMPTHTQDARKKWARKARTVRRPLNSIYPVQCLAFVVGVHIHHNELWAQQRNKKRDLLLGKYSNKFSIFPRQNLD